MMLFWLITAVFVAIALAFVIPPLLQRGAKENESEVKEANVAIYRDQIAELDADLRNGLTSPEQYQLDRDEIERRLLEDVTSDNKTATQKAQQAAPGYGPAYALALCIPIIAIAMYMKVGTPAAVKGVETTAPQVQASQPAGQGGMTAERMQANVAALARRLEQNPNDLQGWKMLGRSYVVLEKYQEASQAYAKAAALKPDDADLLADLAFTLGMANGQKLEGQPFELIKKALKLDPDNAKALELGGSAAYEAGDYKLAISYWQKLLAKSPADSELTQSLNERINEARQKAEAVK